MVLSGKQSGKRDTPEEVAVDTLAVLMENVPSQIAGIVFLSGGQTPDQATENLAAITKRAKEVSAPWPLTFSMHARSKKRRSRYGREREENIPAARSHSSRASPVSLPPQCN